MLWQFAYLLFKRCAHGQRQPFVIPIINNLPPNLEAVINYIRFILLSKEKKVDILDKFIQNKNVNIFFFFISFKLSIKFISAKGGSKKKNIIFVIKYFSIYFIISKHYISTIF